MKKRFRGGLRNRSPAADHIATFISEDLTCIATGVLIAQGKLGFWSGTAACLAGIYAGDLALFAAGRLLGRAALSSALFRKFVSPAKVDRASEWLAARGLVVIFLSRFTPGLRLPTYFVAGLLKTEFARFAVWFLAAAAIWTPLLVGLTTVLGEKSRLYANVFAVALFAAWKLGPQLRARRRLVGFLKRKFRWEFWPAWAAYLPVLPYILYLGLKHRSLTLFTAANPGVSRAAWWVNRNQEFWIT